VLEYNLSAAFCRGATWHLPGFSRKESRLSEAKSKKSGNSGVESDEIELRDRHNSDETDVRGKGIKSTKKAKKTKSGKKPTREEIMARIFEKDEELNKLNKKISAFNVIEKELNDKWLRSVAELENYRKRTLKEWELHKRQTKAEVILEVLNVVDDFERAISAIGEDQGDDFVQGVLLIYNNLVLTLERLGVKPVEALDQPFEPAFHMAIAQVESDSVESNHVVEVVQKGYLLDDAVIRPAKVIIAK
jgi:molecular chaperone GrpE